jgi:hypothetical protein
MAESSLMSGRSRSTRSAIDTPSTRVAMAPAGTIQRDHKERPLRCERSRRWRFATCFSAASRMAASSAAGGSPVEASR